MVLKTKESRNRMQITTFRTNNKAASLMDATYPGTVRKRLQK